MKTRASPAVAGGAPTAAVHTDLPVASFQLPSVSAPVPAAVPSVGAVICPPHFPDEETRLREGRRLAQGRAVRLGPQPRSPILAQLFLCAVHKVTYLHLKGEGLWRVKACPQDRDLDRVQARLANVSLGQEI